MENTNRNNAAMENAATRKSNIVSKSNNASKSNVVSKFNEESQAQIKRLLGKDRWVSNDDLHSGFNNNDLIIGGSGTGKTGGYVIPNIRQGYGNMIVTDTKSQLCRLLEPELKRKGYEISVLDFVNPERSEAYNPLDYIRAFYDERGNAKYSEKDIVSLSRAMIPASNSRDPFWENSARTVLTFLIAFTKEALVPKEHTMSTVVELYRVLQNNPEKLKGWVAENPDSFAAKKFKMFEKITQVDRTWECICQFVSAALDPFDFTEMQHIFGNRNNKKLRLDDMWKKKKIIFLNVSDNDRYADRLANIFYIQAMQQLCNEADKRKNGRLPIPVRFILDDFAANIYIEDFDKLISVIRSRNISVSVILQSLTQLEAMYSSAQANTIITNCDHLLYLGGQDIATAHYVGYRSNKPEETVLLMPQGKAYLIERGKRGIQVDRVAPYENVRTAKPQPAKPRTEMPKEMADTEDPEELPY